MLEGRINELDDAIARGLDPARVGGQAKILKQHLAVIRGRDGAVVDHGRAVGEIDLRESPTGRDIGPSPIDEVAGDDKTAAGKYLYEAVIAALLGGIGISDVEVDRAMIDGINRTVIRIAQIIVEDDRCVDGLDEAADRIDRSALVIEGQGRVVDGFVDAEIGTAGIGDGKVLVSAAMIFAPLSLVSESVVSVNVLPPVAVSVPALVRVVSSTVNVPSVDLIVPVLSTVASTMALCRLRRARRRCLRPHR